ncbi:sensor histidine kinase [Geodermatophilus sp. SYSU D00691]
MRASAAVLRRQLTAERPDAAEALRWVARSALELVRADVVAVLQRPEGTLEPRVEAAVGHGGPTPGGWPPDGLGSVLGVPLPGQAAGGELVLGRFRGRPDFTEEERELAADLAVHAAVALALATSQYEQQQAAVLADRSRIATELHDDVLRRLFAIGMTLHSVAAGLVPGAAAGRVRDTAAERLQAAVVDLDRTINHVQRTVFALQDEVPGESPRVGARLIDAIAEVSGALGFEPVTQVTGSLDELPPDVLTDLRVVVREALANIARHARARAAEVAVTATGGTVTVAVTDDGVGLVDVPDGGGLADLRRRARWHGGHMTVEPVPSGGTCLTWAVPVERS